MIDNLLVFILILTAYILFYYSIRCTYSIYLFFKTNVSAGVSKSSSNQSFSHSDTDTPATSFPSEKSEFEARMRELEMEMGLYDIPNDDVNPDLSSVEIITDEYEYENESRLR